MSISKWALVGLAATACGMKKSTQRAANQQIDACYSVGKTFNENNQEADENNNPVAPSEKSFDLSCLAQASIAGFISGIMIPGPVRLAISSCLSYSLCKNFTFQSQDSSAIESQTQGVGDKLINWYNKWSGKSSAWSTQYFITLPHQFLQFCAKQVLSEHKAGITIGMAVATLVPCSKLKPILQCIPFFPDKLKAFLPFSIASYSGEYGLFYNQYFYGYVNKSMSQLPQLQISGKDPDLCNTNWDY